MIDLINNKPQQIAIYFDGACDNRNGTGENIYGCGIVAFNAKGEVLKEVALAGEKLGTSNIAEWCALTNAIFMVAELAGTYPQATFKILGDSQLIIRQFNGQYGIKQASFEPFYNLCKAMAKGLPIDSVEWVRRELNQYADDLSKEGLDKATKLFKK
jgi:ribonuclease HI